MMGSQGCVVVVGGTSGLGRDVAEHYAKQGRDVVLTGRDGRRAADVAAEIGGSTRGIALDLAFPREIGVALADVPAVRHLVVSAIDRDTNTAADYDVDRALYLVTLKLVGYTEVVHQLRPRMSGDASIVLFGGQALRRPYPGSTTVSTVNGGVVGMVHTLATELAPVRVNGVHPGIVGDSPYWLDKEQARVAAAARTPTGRLVSMAEVTSAVVFLLENGGVNGENLAVDGGWLLK
jgi:NAD(P)-dependent dehydrogenase (short-subunit alcohol dehydrogenase family)